MNFKKVLLLIVLSNLFYLISFGQEVEPVPEGKSVVYFMRPNALGFAINFTYYDNDKVIGKFKGRKYLRYECLPGEHVFWARSENRSFILADLKEGEMYIIDAQPAFGALRAGVQLFPVNPHDENMKPYQKLLVKKESEGLSDIELLKLNTRKKKDTEKGLKKFAKLKAKGYNFRILSQKMFVTEEDLVFVRKK